MKFLQPPAETCFCQDPKLISIAQLFLPESCAESGLSMQISTLVKYFLKSSYDILESQNTAINFYLLHHLKHVRKNENYHLKTSTEKYSEKEEKQQKGQSSNLNCSAQHWLICCSSSPARIENKGVITAFKLIIFYCEQLFVISSLLNAYR